MAPRGPQSAALAQLASRAVAGDDVSRAGIFGLLRAVECGVVLEQSGWHHFARPEQLLALPLASKCPAFGDGDAGTAFLVVKKEVVGDVDDLGERARDLRFVFESWVNVLPDWDGAGDPTKRCGLAVRPLRSASRREAEDRGLDVTMFTPVWRRSADSRKFSAGSVSLVQVQRRVGGAPPSSAPPLAALALAVAPSGMVVPAATDGGFAAAPIGGSAAARGSMTHFGGAGGSAAAPHGAASGFAGGSAAAQSFGAASGFPGALTQQWSFGDAWRGAPPPPDMLGAGATFGGFEGAQRPAPYGAMGAVPGGPALTQQHSVASAARPPLWAAPLSTQMYHNAYGEHVPMRFPGGLVPTRSRQLEEWAARKRREDREFDRDELMHNWVELVPKKKKRKH